MPKPENYSKIRLDLLVLEAEGLQKNLSPYPIAGAGYRGKTVLRVEGWFFRSIFFKGRGWKIIWEVSVDQ